MRGGEAIDGRDIHGEPAARAEPEERGVEDGVNLTTCPADEDGVGIGEGREDLGSPAGDGPDVGDAKGFGVRLDQGEGRRLRARSRRPSPG